MVFQTKTNGGQKMPFDAVVLDQNDIVENSHAHQHRPPEASVEDVYDWEEGNDVEDRTIVG